MTTWIRSIIALLLSCFAIEASAQQATLYERRNTWSESMQLLRERYVEWQGTLAVQLGPWYATRPLPAPKFADECFPERGVELEARGEDGKRLWRKRAEWTDGVVHGLPKRDRASTYLFRTITANGPLAVLAGFGSDDGMELWLNGEKILSRDVARGPAPDQERVQLDLVAGENRLLFKVHNNAGGHGFYFSLRADPLAVAWREMKRDFPFETGWMERDLSGGKHMVWFQEGDKALKAGGELIAAAISGLELADSDAMWSVPRTGPLLETYIELCHRRATLEELDGLDLEALQRAIDDLSRSFPETYTRGPELAARLDELADDLPNMHERVRKGKDGPDPGALAALRREALLANPLLDFEKVLLVKRRADSPKLGLPQNWQGNCSLPRSGFADEIATLAIGEAGAVPETFFRPEKDRMIADLELDFDAGRMLFSMLGSHERWQIWELGADGASLRQVTPGEHDDVDNYDACYLPDGRIIFDSTRVFQGIPCVTGSDAVANLFVMDSGGGNMRQLCFDQDHDWCPTVLNNGRVLYTRWEYSDTPHYFTRLLFHMNPDGTGQMEYYGSNSFWPNSIFFARPIPGHPTQVAGIVSGHHGVPRMGELVIFDPAKGRFEADGVVQRIPGHGEEVEPVIVDQLVNQSWPRFLHPWPLSEEYFLVSCQPTAQDPWGIYLVDVFDNVLLLCEEPGYALLEPIPFLERERPPIVPDKVDLSSTEATIYLADVYAGPGLANVPRGSVKELRLYDFHYAYPQMGGHKHVGVEGCWDVHRVMGTVPVEEDGSASFTVPANTPIALQPLDEEGKALQLMRSWFTAMPGEVLSCAGCHESQNTSPPPRRTIAARRAPSEIEPWYGPTRGLSFERELQPVLDRHCVGCHDGRTGPDGTRLLDLRRKPEKGWLNFTQSYLALHPYVRRPGPESDYHLLMPLEYHADTSELVQMLKKGHHGVELDAEAWDRLITWIDLNVPDHGTWGEHRDIASDFRARRVAMLAAHANRREDPEEIPDLALEEVEFLMPEEPERPGPLALDCPGWPFDADEAGEPLELDLGHGVSMSFVRVPAGEFVMGDADGYLDELPISRVAIEEPFWLGGFEVTREQYSRFDPSHTNGTIDQQHKDHTLPGYSVDDPELPAIRVSWSEAMDFCVWLSEKTGRRCTLPSEAQWEWACRAGKGSPLSYGDLDTDFAKHANLADASLRRMAVTGVNPQPIPNPNQYQDFLPKDERFDDGAMLMAAVGSYQPNAFGLFDMHGNVGEWTRSGYAPYPYDAEDGREDCAPSGTKVVRGGSWSDRPRRARSAHRLPYRAWQGVHDVGFRVLVEVGP